MMLYKNTMVCSTDGNINFFNIMATVLRGDTFAPYRLIIYLDYTTHRPVEKA